MKSMVAIISGIAIVTIVTGCSSSQQEDAAAPAALEQGTAAVVQEAMNVEIACAGCIYKMDGIKTCIPAVKIGEKPMLLTGTKVDAHGLGMCKEAKQASVVGRVEGDNFVAEKVNLL